MFRLLYTLGICFAVFLGAINFPKAQIFGPTEGSVAVTVPNAPLLGGDGTNLVGVSVGSGLTLSSNVLSGNGGTLVTAVYTSNTATLSIPATNNLIEVIRQGTPAALLANLPASPGTNLQVCVKDGGNGFATNNTTVKTTDSTQIDGVAGATGFVMNQNKQHACFVYDGAQWDVI